MRAGGWWCSSWCSSRVWHEPWLSWARVYEPRPGLPWSLSRVLECRLGWLLWGRGVLVALLPRALRALHVASLLTLLRPWPLCWLHLSWGPVVSIALLWLAWLLLRRAVGCTIQGW